MSQLEKLLTVLISSYLRPCFCGIVGTFISNTASCTWSHISQDSETNAVIDIMLQIVVQFPFSQWTKKTGIWLGEKSNFFSYLKPHHNFLRNQLPLHQLYLGPMPPEKSACSLEEKAPKLPNCCQLIFFTFFLYRGAICMRPLKKNSIPATFGYWGFFLLVACFH